MNKFLTRFLFSPEEAKEHAVCTAHDLHATIFSMFAPLVKRLQPARTEENSLLYRDHGLQNGKRNVLIYSTDFPEECAFGKIATKTIPNAYFERKEYLFDIVVNPVKTIYDTFVNLVQTGGVMDWFIGRCAKEGIAITKVLIVRNYVVQFSKKTKSIPLQCSHIQGVLSVTDREKFRRICSIGLGPGKAYGCGLFELYPL